MADYDAALYIGRYDHSTPHSLASGEASEAMMDINSRLHVRLSREYGDISRDLDLIKHGEGILGQGSDDNYPYLDSEVIGIASMAYTEVTPVAVDDGDATLLLADHYGRLQVNLEKADYGNGTARRPVDIQEQDEPFESFGLAAMGRRNEQLGLSVDAQGDATVLATDAFGRLLIAESETATYEFYKFSTQTCAKNEAKVVATRTVTTALGATGDGWNAGPAGVLQLDQLGASCSDMCKVELYQRDGAAAPSDGDVWTTTGDDTLIMTWFVSGAMANANLDVLYKHPLEFDYGDGDESYILVMMPMKHNVDVYGFIKGKDA